MAIQQQVCLVTDQQRQLYIVILTACITTGRYFSSIDTKISNTFLRCLFPVYIYLYFFCRSAYVIKVYYIDGCEPYTVGTRIKITQKDIYTIYMYIYIFISIYLYRKYIKL